MLRAQYSFSDRGVAVNCDLNYNLNVLLCAVQRPMFLLSQK